MGKRRTDDEIVARIEERKDDDFFGFETGDLIICLPFDKAKPYLKPDTTAEEWRQASAEPGEVRERAREYLDFAWDKANSCRGLSAGRSLNHFAAWLWLAGEEAFLRDHNNFNDYTYYGKPQLVAISELLGFDWRAVDDSKWRNSESDDGLTAEQALAA